MTDEEFEEYLGPLAASQADGIRRVRAIITALAPGLEEHVNTGRWLGGLIFYSAGGHMVFAVGPRGKTTITLHMMPFYGSTALRERHGEALAPFLTGKSCLSFRAFGDLPAGVLDDIVVRGTPAVVEALAGRPRGRPTGAMR